MDIHASSLEYVHIGDGQKSADVRNTGTCSHLHARRGSLLVVLHPGPGSQDAIDQYVSCI